jgi:MerR family transcriptional regulator, redox-sensitive transcriptional activator SoxR
MTRSSPEPSELSVGQLAARSGVTVSTLHFYEAEGLITSRRTPGNQRRYPRATLRRVAFIRVSQRAGIPLRRIKEALDQLPSGRRRPGGTGPACRPSGGKTSTSGSANSRAFGTA